MPSGKVLIIARTKYKGNKTASGRSADFTYWAYKALMLFGLPVGSRNGVLKQHHETALLSFQAWIQRRSGSNALHMIPHDVYAK
jgi:hypothetical protein